MAFPVHNVVRPALLKGRSNGQLSDSDLITTPGLAGGPAIRLVAPAAAAWVALSAAALAAGHTLKSSGFHDSYRPFDVQKDLFTTRFTKTELSGRPHRKWQGATWFLKHGEALAAVPGTSNHGWGLAVDVGVEIDGDPTAERLSPAALKWLLDNEERFGFSHEVQSESWHIRYFAGDHPPATVLMKVPAIGGSTVFVVQRDGDPAQFLIGLPGGPFHYGPDLIAPFGVLPHVRLPNSQAGINAMKQILEFATPKPAGLTDAQVAQLSATIAEHLKG